MAQISRDRNSLSHSVQGNYNLFNRNGNTFTAGAFADGTSYFNSPINRLDRFGGNLGWQNQNGNSASFQYSRIPQLNMDTYGANAKLNIYNKEGLRIDAYGGASRSSGPSSNRRIDWNGGLTGIWYFK